MLKITADEANRRVIIQVNGAPDKIKTGIRRAFYNLGGKLRKSASDSILEKPKHGRIYLVRKGKRLYRHQASAPGEAPANLSGTLRRSLGFDVRGSNQMEFGVRDGKATYGKDLELGTKRMLKRPFLIKAIKANERNAREFFTNEIDKALKQ